MAEAGNKEIGPQDSSKILEKGFSSGAINREQWTRLSEKASGIAKKGFQKIKDVAKNIALIPFMATSEEIDDSLKNVPQRIASKATTLGRQIDAAIVAGDKRKIGRQLDKLGHLADEENSLRDFYELKREESLGIVRPGEPTKRGKEARPEEKPVVKAEEYVAVVPPEPKPAAGEPPKEPPPVPPSSEQAIKEPEILGEEIIETEGGATRFKHYQFENINQVVDVVRNWLDNTKILGDAPIHPLENSNVYDKWLGKAKEFADKEKDEDKKAKLKETYSELVKEYESIRRALDWWHNAAREPHKANEAGGFSKGKDTFNAGIGLGSEYSGEYILWLKNSHRKDDFIRGFATPKADLKNTHFNNASEYLGAQLRSSCGIGTKDPGSSFPFVNSDGEKILVVNSRGEIMEQTKPTNAFMYEIHKQLAMDGYAYKYLRVRHKMMDAAFEPVMIPDPQNPDKTIQVFISHISADRLWAYDAFQHPKHMAKLWYANLDVLNSDELNSSKIAEENGRHFLEQLGWRNDLDPDPKINTQLNKLHMGSGYDFIHSKDIPPDLNEKLCKKYSLKWDEKLDESKKLEILQALGMIDLFGSIPYGYRENYYLLTHLIELDTEKIPEEIWKKMDWSKIKDIGGAFLSDWCQQQVYLQKTRNNLITILSGGTEEESLPEALKFIGSAEGWRHIADIIAPVAEREKSWWWEACSNMLIQPYFINRMKGQRVDEVAVPINQLMTMGLYMQTYAQEFEDVGLPGHNWTDLYEHPIRETSSKVAKILAKFNCRWEAWGHYMKGILENTQFANLSDKEKFWALVAYANFRMVSNDAQDPAKKFNGYHELRERIERNIAEPNETPRWQVEQAGRVVNYFDFELDKDREWGMEVFHDKLGEKGFKALMETIDDKIKRSGYFNRFYEKMDEEEIICKLLDQWLDEVYNRDSKNYIKKAWGLPMSWYKREILFNQALRDMKYGIGKFQKDFVLEQLETDSSHKVKDKRTINGETIEFETDNIQLEPNTISGFKDGKIQPLAEVWQPRFPMFHNNNLGYCRGRDIVWSMLEGTGEWFPGMAKRLTPLYIHYNRDRYMNLFIMMFADPLFRLKAFENAGRNWEEDKAFFFIANPLKLRNMVDMIDQLESDPDWAQNWRGKLNITSAEMIAEFTRERREIRVLNAEAREIIKASSEEDILAMQNFALTAFKLVEPSGLLAGPLGSIFGRTGKEFGQRVLAMTPGAVTGFTLFGLPTLLTPLTPEAGGLAIALRLITTGAFTFGGGMVSNVVLGGDAGVDQETGLEREAYDSTILGNIRKAWKLREIGVPLSLMRARMDARSYEKIMYGTALWDDLVPAERVTDFLFKNPKAKLQHAPRNK